MDKKKSSAKTVKREDFEKLQSELDSVRTLAGQLEGQLKRAVADYHNLEKRVNEGRSELTKWGTSELIKKMVPSLDHLDQAVMGASESGENSGWLEGVKLAIKEIRKTLEEEGLKPVQTEIFDPNVHEAVDIQEGPEGTILKVTEMGYMLNDKILKPAKVVVGREASNNG